MPKTLRQAFYSLTTGLIQLRHIQPIKLFTIKTTEFTLLKGRNNETFQKPYRKI